MQSLEIAVYEVAQPEGFRSKQVDLHRSIAATFDGSLISLGLQSLTESNVFADVVLWASHDAAVAAAEAVAARPEFAWLRDEIGAMRVFEHLAPARPAEDPLVAIGGAPVVELVLVRSGLDGFAAAHEALHDELASADVIVDELRLEANETGLAGDVNGWTEPDAMEAMGPEMMHRPELGPVFDPGNEMLLFMPFRTNVAP